MCLITSKSNKPVILTEDKIVYKYVDRLTSDVCSALYQACFNYELGELYKTDIKESTDPKFASFEDGVAYKEVTGSSNIDEQSLQTYGHIAYGEGFHSMTEPKSHYMSGVCVQCTIPKGSTVIEGYCGYLISDQIIINKYL